METPAGKKQASGLANKKIIVIGAAIIALLVAAIAFLLMRQSTMNIADEGVPKIGYAAEATVMLDQNSLQAAMDAAMEKTKDGNVALRYKNNAFSTNGTDFECYIGNSSSNVFDMFLTIYADAEMTDQVFLSGLVPPGSGFENITLDHALESGNHTVYVVVTQVADDENGQQVIKNQVVHTMDFHVED